jgi:glycerol uptake facilitator-like aquaporin
MQSFILELLLTAMLMLVILRVRRREGKKNYGWDRNRRSHACHTLIRIIPIDGICSSARIA